MLGAVILHQDSSRRLSPLRFSLGRCSSSVTSITLFCCDTGRETFTTVLLLQDLEPYIWVSKLPRRLKTTWNSLVSFENSDVLHVHMDSGLYVIYYDHVLGHLLKVTDLPKQTILLSSLSVSSYISTAS